VSLPARGRYFCGEPLVSLPVADEPDPDGALELGSVLLLEPCEVPADCEVSLFPAGDAVSPAEPLIPALLPLLESEPLGAEVELDPLGPDAVEPEPLGPEELAELSEPLVEELPEVCAMAPVAASAAAARMVEVIRAMRMCCLLCAADCAHPEPDCRPSLTLRNALFRRRRK
jgi:hypothetical protein